MFNFEGKIASQGIIDGKAFVTNKPLDCPPFEEYILITQNLDPEMSVLIYKSKGVITQYGGLMCHLAVVSRELKIPCIVGVKDITKILKTGDIIKLDLNTCEIKIIK